MYTGEKVETATILRPHFTRSVNGGSPLARHLLVAAVGVLLAHNHPSGDLTPSGQDSDLTRPVREALNPLGVAVHDHLIVSANGYFSFHEQNLL